MLRFGSDVLREEEGEGSPGGQPGLFEEKPEKKEPNPELAQLSQKVDALTGFLQRSSQQQRPQPSQDQNKQLESAFFERPLQTTAHLAQQVAAHQAAQIRNEMYPMQVRAARDDARNQDAEVFDKYRGEIDEWVRSTYDPQHHTNEFVWRQGLNHVKATKLDEISAFKSEKKKAAAALNAPSRRGYQSEEPQGLDDDEREAARVLGISDSKYEAARKQHREERSAPVEGRDMVKSHWGDVVTLSSKKPAAKKRANA